MDKGREANVTYERQKYCFMWPEMLEKLRELFRNSKQTERYIMYGNSFYF